MIFLFLGLDQRLHHQFLSKSSSAYARLNPSILVLAVCIHGSDFVLHYREQMSCLCCRKGGTVIPKSRSVAAPSVATVT